MALINGYSPQVTPNPYIANKLWTVKRVEELGGFNAATGKITVFKKKAKSYDDADEMLWNITEAIEAGAVEEQTFMRSFFKTAAQANAFADELAGGSEFFWLNDRHFSALMTSLQGNEDAMRTYEEAGVFIRQAIEDEYA
jgi:hypothetical protein